MPLFSIITITKNNTDGFARTRTSVQAQIFDDYEWIVIDGDVEPDHGIYDAMNKGITRARGDYLIFMNAGDVFAADDILMRIAPLLEDSDFAYGDALEGGYYKPAHHTIARGMVTHHQAMIFKKSARLYDTRYIVSADYKYTAEAIRDAKSIVYLPFAVCIFETGGLSQRRTKLGRTEQAAIRQELDLHALFIGVVQILSQFLKNTAPRVYWILRAKRK